MFEYTICIFVIYRIYYIYTQYIYVLYIHHTNIFYLLYIQYIYIIYIIPYTVCLHTSYIYVYTMYIYIHHTDMPFVHIIYPPILQSTDFQTLRIGFQTEPSFQTWDGQGRPRFDWRVEGLDPSDGESIGDNWKVGYDSY